MNEFLSVAGDYRFDESVVKVEYHSYSPYLNSFNNSDEIRIGIQQQDLYVLPSRSFIYIEGKLLKVDDTVSATARLVNNAIAYLFDSIRYELNGVEIDCNKYVGQTTTLKNFVSLTQNESKMLYNAGWSPDNNISLPNGNFNFCVPLEMLLGFAEDFKKIVINAKHELILTRSRTDENAVVSEIDDVVFTISKLQWRVPHVTPSDSGKLSLLKIVDSRKPLKLTFRSWELYEYPLIPATTNHSWSVKTSSQLEKPRYVIFGMQTNRKNQRGKDIAKFDHCDLINVKLHLNSESFPYDDMNIRFSENRFALLYSMYANFQQSYYGFKQNPLLDPDHFLANAPIIVIDCSYQNESIKSGPVDIKLEFITSNPVPPMTSAYCLLLHDRIVEYTPLTNEVRRRV